MTGDGLSGEAQTTNVLLPAVGGQGAMLGSEVLALVAVADGFQVKQTEVHGVAQRYGAVVSHVRFGPRVWSPVIPMGRADLLLGFEKLETLRLAHYLKPGGTIIADDRVIKPFEFGPPMPYPKDAYAFLAAKGYRVLVIRATDKAREIGAARVASMVMLGAAATVLPLTRESWDRVIRERVPSRWLEQNLRAFDAGQELAARAMERLAARTA